MTYARKIILHSPPWNSPLLEGFVNRCIRDRVALVCFVGDDCERVHDVFDEIIVGILVGHGQLPEDDALYGPITTWHVNESLEEVLAFAEAWRVGDDEYASVDELTLQPLPPGA
jgi:hypothetical protein